MHFKNEFKIIYKNEKSNKIIPKTDIAGIINAYR